MRYTRAYIAVVISFVIVASSCCKVGAQLGSEFDGPNYTIRSVSNTSSESTARIRSGYHHVWPEMKFGWKIVVGTIITVVSAALGSVGGAGGDGQFVPMLALIIGFDQKSAVALSKCMIFGGAATTVLYNLRQRHEGSPVIDYNLALLFNPLMILGTSIGVVLNVFLAVWMLTICLIILLLVAAIKSFLKGIKTWKTETLLKKEMAACTQVQPVNIVLPNNGNTNDHQEVEINDSNIQAQSKKVSVLENVYWKELGIIFVLWTVVLILQIAKTNSTACSLPYWLFDYSQMPATIGVSLYQAVSLYKGHKVIASKRDTNYQVRKLIAYCGLGILAGIFSGMLGVGGGVMLSPLFLHLGIPPQVSSATATLIMVFSSSMTVVEYHLLKRFPVPYALFFAAVSAVSAILGQAVIGKLIRRSGRRSVIIFILAFLMVLSIAGVGGAGMARSIKKIQRNEYMGFEDICSYDIDT